jgi:subtilisin family serine protease
VNNDSHANDDEYHGTHVASTIAEATNNSLAWPVSPSRPRSCR